jgi:hypothetical protein
MAYIELVNNPIQIFEENEIQTQKDNLGLQTYWQWEHKLLRQEQEYFQQHLQALEAQVSLELEELSSKQGSEAADDVFTSQLRKEVEAKFAKKRQFLEAGLKRAQLEESVHVKQEKYSRYDRLF